MFYLSMIQLFCFLLELNQPKNHKQQSSSQQVQIMSILISAQDPSLHPAFLLSITSEDAIHEITKSTKDESLLKITEYPKIGNGINNKNKTPKKLATAIFEFCRYRGIISLFRAFHSVKDSLAHTASIRCSPLTIRILKSDSLTFLPSATIFNKFTFYAFVSSN